MTSYKYALLAGAAGVALMGASPASAFDKVNWTWDADIVEKIWKDVDIDINLDPNNLVMLEGLQVHIGNLSASSSVNGVTNHQPSNSGGDGLVDFTVTLDGHYSDQAPTDGQLSGTATLGGGQLTGGTSSVSGMVDEGAPDTVDAVIKFENVAVHFDPAGSFDAMTQLPSVVSAATAVANNLSIDTDAAVQLHSGQFTFGGFNTINTIEEAIGGLASAYAFSVPDNSNLQGVLGLTVAGAFGLIGPSNISAVSNVSNIVNASVDSTATAVGNNLSVNIDTGAAGSPEALLIGDATQFSFAHISAASNVSGVNVYNYNNLGKIGPLVNSAATAVGNNLSVTVKKAVGN